MAWLNEEERATQQGRFAPTPDFNMGVRQPDAVARSFPKVKAETGQFDSVLSSVNKMYSTYEKNAADLQKTEVENQQNALLNDYAIKLNDLRGQFSSGQIGTAELSRRERQLANSYLQAGAPADKISSLRSSFGGQDAQKAEAAAMSAQAKNIEAIQKERAEALAKENPAFAQMTYAERIAVADKGEMLRRATSEWSSVWHNPNISDEEKQVWKSQVESSAAGLVFFKAQNALESYFVQNKEASLTPDVYLAIENQATADLMNEGFSEEEARFLVKQTLKGQKEFADTNFGVITNRSKMNEEVVKTLKNQSLAIMYKIAPITMLMSNLPGQFGQTATTIGGLRPEIQNELAALSKSNTAATDSLKVAQNGADIPAYKGANEAQGAITLFAKGATSDLVTYAPDAAGGVYLVGSKNFNNVNFDMSGHGVVGLSDEDREKAIENGNNFKSVFSSVGGMSKVRKDVYDLCKEQQQCYSAGMNILYEFNTPGSELSQAALFLRNSVMNGNLRLKEDGTIGLAKSSGILQRTGELFYQSQYLKNLDTINNVLKSQNDRLARRYMVMTMFGADIQEAGATPMMEDTFISGIMSKAIEGVGKGVAILSDNRGNFGEPLESVDREPAQYSDKYRLGGIKNTISDWWQSQQQWDKPQETVKESSSTQSKTLKMSFPSVAVEPSSEEGRKLLKEKKEIELAIKGPEGSNDSLNAIIDRFKKNGWDASVFEEERDKLLQRYEEIDKNLYYDPEEDLLPMTAEEYAQRAQAYLVTAAKNQGVDPALLDALFTQESQRGTLTTSHTGVRGAMQITRKTFNEIAPKINLTPEDFEKPEAQMEAGAYYLKEKLNEFGGDRAQAVAAYNAGATPIRRAVRKYKNKWLEHIEEFVDREKAKEIRTHVKKILGYYEEYLGNEYA